MYLIKCECGEEIKVDLQVRLPKICKKCGLRYFIDNGKQKNYAIKPYKLVETEAVLFEDVTQKRGNKNSQVPVDVRNKINIIFGKKCNYTDKRKNCYSMKWHGNYTTEQVNSIQQQLPDVIEDIYIKTKKDYPDWMSDYLSQPYIRVLVKKEKVK